MGGLVFTILYKFSPLDQLFIKSKKGGKEI